MYFVLFVSRYLFLFFQAFRLEFIHLMLPILKVSLPWLLDTNILNELLTFFKRKTFFNSSLLLRKKNDLNEICEQLHYFIGMERQCVEN